MIDLSSSTIIHHQPSITSTKCYKQCTLCILIVLYKSSLLFQHNHTHFLNLNCSLSELDWFDTFVLISYLEDGFYVSCVQNSIFLFSTSLSDKYCTSYQRYQNWYMLKKNEFYLNAQHTLTLFEWTPFHKLTSIKQIIWWKENQWGTDKSFDIRPLSDSV